MKTKLCRLLSVLALGLIGSAAQAAITCSMAAQGFVSVYDGLAATSNLNQSSFTLSCSRLSTDATTLNFIAFTDDGGYNNGANNRARSPSGAFIQYDFFTTSAYSVNWSKSSRCIVGSVNFGSALSATQTVSYFSRIPAAQTGIPAANYTDTVRASVAYGPTACQNNAPEDVGSTFSVAISTVPACQIAVPPGNVAFSYTAFSQTPATANTSFQARCSTTLPYTLAINGTQSGGIYGGVVSGLNYGLSIALTTTGPPILPTTSRTGNGALETFFINGTMPAGQAGTCPTSTCNANDPRTLTITF